MQSRPRPISALALSLSIALLASGCGLLPLGGRATGAVPSAGASPLGRGLHEYRVAFHVHSYLSHDSQGPIDRIASAARALGFSAVILNDHYESGNVARAPRGMVDGVLFLPGVETRPENGGSILAFPLREDYQREGMKGNDRLAEYARQGAVNVLGHVEETHESPLPYAGFEVYNLHAQFNQTPWWQLPFRLLFLPPDLFFEASMAPPTANLGAWDAAMKEKGAILAPLAGHDAHENVRLLGVTLGTYPELLRLFSTHVLAPELTVEAITEAVRAARTFIVFEPWGDATGFSFTAHIAGAPGSPSKEAIAIPGDVCPWKRGASLEARVPRQGGRTPTIRLLRDGHEMASRIAWNLAAIPAPGPGLYRVEVWRGARLWVLSAPIQLTPSGDGDGEPAAEKR